MPGRVALAEVLERLQGGGLVDIGLENRRQSGESVVEVEPIAEAVERVQVRDERREVLRPEDKAIHILRRQRDQIPLAPIRRHDTRETFLNAAHEPVAIKGGNIRPSRYRD